MINNRFTRWLAGRALRRCAATAMSRKPDLTVVRPDGERYLERWWLIPRNRWFNIYLHRYLADDDPRALHDHPWWSVSLCLIGALEEVYRDPMSGRSAKAGVHSGAKGADPGADLTRSIPFGSLVFRRPTFAHRLVVPVRWTMTLFVTGPRIRAWGFLCPNLPGGWLHWEKFTGRDEDGRSGGCGEA